MSNSAVIVISGIAASGKTTVANRLSAYYAMAVYSPDSIAEALRHSKTSGDASLDLNQAALDVLYSVCDTQLDNGLNVIVDTSLSYPDLWQRLRRDCEQAGGKLVPIVLECSSEVAAERARKRLEQEPEQGIGSVDGQASHSGLESLGALGDTYYKIDANGDADEVFAQAVTIVDTALDLWETIPCGVEPE